MAIPHHQWTVYSRRSGASSTKASAYASRSREAKPAPGSRAGRGDKPFSAVAAAAYASRTKTWDKRYVPEVQDYSAKEDLVCGLLPVWWTPG